MEQGKLNNETKVKLSEIEVTRPTPTLAPTFDKKYNPRLPPYQDVVRLGDEAGTRTQLIFVVTWKKATTYAPIKLELGLSHTVHALWSGLVVVHVLWSGLVVSHEHC